MVTDVLYSSLVQKKWMYSRAIRLSYNTCVQYNSLIRLDWRKRFIIIIIDALWLHYCYISLCSPVSLCPTSAGTTTPSCSGWLTAAVRPAHQGLELKERAPGGARGLLGRHQSAACVPGSADLLPSWGRPLFALFILCLWSDLRSHMRECRQITTSCWG